MRNDTDKIRLTLGVSGSVRYGNAKKNVVNPFKAKDRSAKKELIEEKRPYSAIEELMQRELNRRR